MRFALCHPIAWLNEKLLDRWAIAIGRKDGRPAIVRTRARR